MPGCFEIRPRVLADDRGHFVKVFHEDIFREHGLATAYAEEYYSVSRRGVLRGLHFQTPPREHTKLVYCALGSVTDAVVDLRRGSPTFGEHLIFSLDAKLATAILIPAGLAHGFLADSEEAIMVYKVTSVYAPEHDSGIAWNSAGIPWRIDHPIVSERDRRLTPLSRFETPFRFT